MTANEMRTTEALSLDQSLHDVVQGLTAAVCRAEALADDLESSDTGRAALARQLARELTRLWRDFLPRLRQPRADEEIGGRRPSQP